jgi:hypothetical protein
MSSPSKNIGQWSLYGLIGFGLIALVLFAVCKMWYWFTAIGICFAGVIGAEIVSFTILKKSISTQYGEWIKRNPLMAYLALTAFGLSMLSLVIHLAAYGAR